VCLVQLLVDFYCDRAKDRHLVIPHVLGGLWALLSYHPLPNGAVKQICSAVFKEIHIQGLSQGDRRYFYNVVLAFLRSHSYEEELKTFAQDFVFGYIQAMDGERDPRNLLIAFSCVKMITEKLPFGNCMCYYMPVCLCLPACLSVRLSVC
jgi:DNA repair/transcription protein MET18/MMS19